MNCILNGFVLNKNTVVAEVINNNVTIIREDLCPLLLLRTKDINEWLNNRVIDKHRPSSRVLRKILILTTSNGVKVVTKFNVISLTDGYWFKETNSDLVWEEAINVIDYFSPIVIKGSIDYQSLPENLRTFELTNTGSYEKCWKSLDDNRWIMVKKQDGKEVISEYLAYKIGGLFNFNVAKYSILQDDLIISENFIENWNYNFEDAYSVVGEDEDVCYNFEIFSKLSPKLVKGYFEMLVFDALVMNVDRHTHNYGLLRDINTGSVVDFSPLYDHNRCLYGSKIVIRDKSPDMFFDAVKIGLNYYHEYEMPKITKEDLIKITDDKVIIDFIYNNYIALEKICENI